DRLAHVILRAAAPAEAAAEVMTVALAFGERHAGGFRQRRDRGLGVLGRHPQLGLVGREPHGGVHHLHAGMRQERRAVDRLHLPGGARDRRLGVAVLPVSVGGGGGEAFLEHGVDRRARGGGVRTL